MNSISAVLVASVLTLGQVTLSSAAEQKSLQVPQSIQIQHEQIISQLVSIAKREGRVGAVASKTLILLKDHYAMEEAFVLPPLGLLPRLAKGEISKDMEPAIAMAERARAASSEFENVHIQITALMNELIEAGKKGNDEKLMHLATRIASQSLNDIEVSQPISIVIGDMLRQRLSKQ